MSTLYKITDELRELQAMCDADYLCADDIEDTMVSLKWEFDKKIEACLQVRQSQLNEVINIDAEIERLTKLKKVPQGNAEWLGHYIKNNMVSRKLDKLDAGLFKLTLRKPTRKLGELNEALIPATYFIEVPATRKLDKRKLLSDAKTFDVLGATVIDSERSLTIK